MTTDKKNLIKKTDASHIAELVRLDISGEEEKFSGILNDTLKYVEVLDELDTKGVGETYQVTGLHNVFQKDGVKETLSQKDALSNAAEEANGLFVAEAVFDR